MRKYIVIGAILIIVYLLAQYAKPEATDWSPSYRTEDKVPFGTYILHQQINEIFPGAKVNVADGSLKKNIESVGGGRSNYIIIATSVRIEEDAYKQMVKYMEAGNHVFIATQQLQGILSDTLGLEISMLPYVKERKYSINFVNPNLRREYDFYFDKGISNQFFVEMDTSRSEVIGQRQNSYANFIKMKFGKGALYVMPNPQLLTNYSLLKEDGREYAEKALSNLPRVKNIIFDEHFSRPASQNESVLRVFFDYDQLRWAYYIALCSLIIFVLFEMKRRQRIIPVIERPKNTSVEFVRTVGQVYYQQRNNLDIAEKKVIYLLDYIRSKYRLRTADLDREFKENLVRVSSATEVTINELLVEISYINTANMVTDAQLIRLNAIIEQFYKQDQ